MKKLIYLITLFLLPLLSKGQSGFGPGGDFIPSGNYPVVSYVHIKGVQQFAQHISGDHGSRDSIPAYTRVEGTVCYVADSLKYYGLVGGISNGNWTALSITNVFGVYAKLSGGNTFNGVQTVNGTVVGNSSAQFPTIIGDRYVFNTTGNTVDIRAKNITTTRTDTLGDRSGTIALLPRATGSTSDSVLTIVNDVVKKVAQSSIGGSGGTPANPTASIGLTTVNGSATTYMRSDAAPPLSQSVAPTWTGKHIFSDTLKEKKSIQIGIQSTVPANGTLHIFGNSIANHTGASDVAHSYTNIMCRDLSLTQDNQAISATVLEAASENLANNMVSRKTSIPTYVKGDWLLFDYIMNDINYNYSDFTTTQFKTDMGTILTYATGTKGWPNNRIVFNTNGYIDSAKYISYFSNPAATPARARAFVQATRDEAALFPGVKVADTYSAYLVQGGTNLVSTSDNLHPNDFGHIVSALVTANAIIDTVRFAKQTLAVSGVTELDTLKHKQLNLLNPTQSFLVGQDKYNNIGLLNILPDSTRAKNFYFDGQRQFGVPINTLPTPATLSDFIVKQDTRIIGMHINGYYQTYTPMEYLTGKTIWKNNFTSGNIYEWWVGSTPSLAFAINYNKQLVGTGATPPNTNPGIWQQYGAQYGAATSSTAGYYTPFYADGTYGDGMSRITNNYGQGRLIFDMSGGTDAASVYMAQLYSNGHFQLQRGGTFTDNPIARLQIKSTTEGVLLPSMTTTQQAAMGYLTLISRSTGGGSYTTAPTVVIGAPNIAGGTQATATCTITGGVVNSAITITNPGTGYTSAPTISFTGGGGSGAAATAAISLTTNEGLENWDNVLHRKSYFDGTNFQSTAWVSDLSSYLPKTGGILTGTLTAPQLIGTGAAVGIANYAVMAQSATYPFVGWYASGNTTDEKLWHTGIVGNTIYFSALNDAEGSADNWLSATRVGATVTSISFNSHKVTGLPNGTSSSDAVNYGQLQGATTIHGNSTTTGTATTAVTVTIGSTMANTNYIVNISPQDLLTAVNWYISAKTTTTFTVTFVSALTGSINFDWGVTP